MYYNFNCTYIQFEPHRLKTFRLFRFSFFLSSLKWKYRQRQSKWSMHGNEMLRQPKKMFIFFDIFLENFLKKFSFWKWVNFFLFWMKLWRAGGVKIKKKDTHIFCNQTVVVIQSANKDSLDIDSGTRSIKKFELKLRRFGWNFN